MIFCQNGQLTKQSNKQEGEANEMLNTKQFQVDKTA